MKCTICKKSLKENTEGNKRYCQGHSIGELTKDYCPNCGAELTKETDKDLKKTYPFVCLKCDENFFKFETVEK